MHNYKVVSWLKIIFSRHHKCCKTCLHGGPLWTKNLYHCCSPDRKGKDKKVIRTGVCDLWFKPLRLIK